MKAFYLNKFRTSHSTATNGQPLKCALWPNYTKTCIYWNFEIDVNKIITSENTALA